MTTDTLAPADDALGRNMPPLAWSDDRPLLASLAGIHAGLLAASDDMTRDGEPRPPAECPRCGGADWSRVWGATWRCERCGERVTAAGHAGPSIEVDYDAVSVIDDAVDLTYDADDLSAALEARDLTVTEAADYLAAELPGAELWLSESATEARGAGPDADGGGRMLTVRCPKIGRVFYGLSTWRAVVADVLAAYRAGKAVRA